MNSTLANELLTARLVDVAKPHLFHLGGSGPATRGRMKQRRRRWPAEEKAAVVRETYESGRSVSLVAREHGIAPSQLFRWRRLFAGAGPSKVQANEEMVPVSDLRELRHQVRELQRLLGKQTLENEMLRQALDRALKRHRS